MNSVAVVHANAVQTLRSGYPRVLQKWVVQKRGKIEPGDIVDIVNPADEFIARGMANPYSRILVRILTFEPDVPIDDRFFYRQLMRAKRYRDAYARDTSYRGVFAEADGLPGLIVDRFQDYLVCQIGTIGMEVRRDSLFAMLQEIYKPKGIMEKSSGSMRKPERLDPRVGLVTGECPELIPFKQDSLLFLNDVMQGQKTGFFLDQRDNRAAMGHYVHSGNRVLDGFCYTGSFSLMATRKGAHVTAFDISERALEVAQQAARRNGLEDQCVFQQGDAFQKLGKLVEDGAQFDMVILDPPAFAKHRGVLPNALRGYEVLNRRALKLLPEGGILVTCSCTQQVSERDFLDMLLRAAQNTSRELRLLEVRGQSFDHPVLASLPETRYLKCVIAQVRNIA